MTVSSPIRKLIEYLAMVAAWLRAGWTSGFGDVSAACEVMFELNRWALVHRRTVAATWIYDLKNRLVRLLYESGYCVSATCQIQKIVCWDCDGRGYWQDQGGNRYGCQHCGGTGVYRQHVLYRFAFDVGGRRYCWHQPDSLVDWEVKLTERAPGIYIARDDDGRERDLTDEAAIARSLVVWWALARLKRAPYLALFEWLRPLLDVRRDYASVYIPFLFIHLNYRRWCLSDGILLDVDWPNFPSWRIGQRTARVYGVGEGIAVSFRKGWYGQTYLRLSVKGMPVGHWLARFRAEVPCAIAGHDIRDEDIDEYDRDETVDLCCRRCQRVIRVARMYDDDYAEQEA